jgi:hypothetical protein
MAGVNKQLTIYSSDGQKLQTSMGFYVRSTGTTSRVNPTTATPIAEYISASRANNDCLVSPDTKSDNRTPIGILRTRANGTDGPATKPYTISETPKAGETNIQAIVRGLGEELGSLIHPDFFHSTSTGVILIVDAAAKPRLINNYQRLVPLTEVYDVQWVPYASPIPLWNKVVHDTDITEHDLLADIDTALAAPGGLPAAPIIEAGNPTITAATDPVSFTNAPHRVAPRPPPTAPRQTGPPPAPPAPAPAPSAVPPPFPDPTVGETLTAYVARVTQGLPSASRALARNYGRSKGLSGGRTIRRKKSKQPKRTGTSKKGVRRSH